MPVADYSDRPAPTARQLLAVGFTGVVRYIGDPDNPKCMTAAEVEDFAAAGIDVALVVEGSAGWMRGGAAAGVNAAKAAVRHARLIGQPFRSLYFAADFDAQMSDLPVLQACINGGVDVVGPVVSLYGGYLPITFCNARYKWQAAGWTHGKLSPLACLKQAVGGVDVGRITVDSNAVLKPDWGQHPYNLVEGNDDVTPDEHNLLQEAHDAYYALMFGTDRNGNDLGDGHFSLQKISERLDRIEAKLDSPQA